MGSPTLMSSPFGRVVRDQQDARRKKRKLPETAEDRLRLKPVVVAIMLRGPAFPHESVNGACGYFIVNAW